MAGDNVRKVVSRGWERDTTFPRMGQAQYEIHYVVRGEQHCFPRMEYTQTGYGKSSAETDEVATQLSRKGMVAETQLSRREEPD